MYIYVYVKYCIYLCINHVSCVCAKENNVQNLHMYLYKYMYICIYRYGCMHSFKNFSKMIVKIEVWNNEKWEVKKAHKQVSREDSGEEI